MPAPPPPPDDPGPPEPVALDAVVTEGFTDAAGVEEVPVVPWPLLVRERLRARVRPTRSPWLVLGISLFGLFSVGFTITLLAITIPTIADDLGTADSTLTWLITGPTLAFGLVGPALAKLGDLHGHKRLSVLSLIGAAVFALLTAAAWNASSLIAFRVIGAGLGSAVGPASIALLNRTFAPEDRVKALGYWSFVGAGGPVLGAVLGAPVVEAVGWRWVFIAQAPMCLAAALVALLFLPETERGRRARFDVAGAVTLAVGLTSLLFALNRGAAWGWTHPGVLAGLALAPLAVAAFVTVERRATDPLIPLAYLRRRNVAAPVANQFLTNFAYMGGFVLTPLLLSKGLGYTTTHVTLLVIFRPLAFSITGPVAGYVTVRIGERAAGVIGAVAVAASMGCLAMIGEGSADWFIAFGLALSGVGLGISSPAMAASVANDIHEDDFGVAGAAQQLVIQVGVAAGIQIMQTVQLATATPGDPVSGYAAAYLTGGAVALVGVVAALAVRSTPRVRAVR